MGLHIERKIPMAWDKAELFDEYAEFYEIFRQFLNAATQENGDLFLQLIGDEDSLSGQAFTELEYQMNKIENGWND
jgi:hypothetical protein